MSRIIKSTETQTMELHTETTAKLKAYARGDMTWAQVEGMTFEQAQAIAQVGCDLAAAGQLEEARILFEGLVEGNEHDTASWAALGTVYQKLGRLSDALNAYDRAIEGDPLNPVALVNRGELRLKAADRNGFSDLAKAIEADPDGETSAGRRARGLVKAITLLAVQQSQKERA